MHVAKPVVFSPSSVEGVLVAQPQFEREIWPVLGLGAYLLAFYRKKSALKDFEGIAENVKL